MATIPTRVATCEQCNREMDVLRTCIRRDDDGLAWFAWLACPICGIQRTHRDPLCSKGA